MVIDDDGTLQPRKTVFRTVNLAFGKRAVCRLTRTYTDDTHATAEQLLSIMYEFDSQAFEHIRVHNSNKITNGTRLRCTHIISHNRNTTARVAGRAERKRIQFFDIFRTQCEFDLINLIPSTNETNSNSVWLVCAHRAKIKKFSLFILRRFRFSRRVCGMREYVCVCDIIKYNISVRLTCAL